MSSKHEDVSLLSNEKIEFGLDYPYSKIFAYLTNLMTDEELKVLEVQILNNTVLKEKVLETKFLIEEHRIDNIDAFKAVMKTKYHIEI